MRLYYVILLDGNYYVNYILYRRIKKSFRKKLILDQVLYPISKEQLEDCKKYDPVISNIDNVLKCFNVLSDEDVKTFQNIKIRDLETMDYKYFKFFRVKDVKRDVTLYPILKRMAYIKICGSLYVALNTVNISVQEPIIATLIN